MYHCVHRIHVLWLLCLLWLSYFFIFLNICCVYFYCHIPPCLLGYSYKVDCHVCYDCLQSSMICVRWPSWHFEMIKAIMTNKRQPLSAISEGHQVFKKETQTYRAISYTPTDTQEKVIHSCTNSITPISEAFCPQHQWSLLKANILSSIDAIYYEGRNLTFHLTIFCTNSANLHFPYSGFFWYCISSVHWTD